MNHAVSGKGCHVFISPVILGDVREELELRRIDLAAGIGVEHGRLHGFQFMAQVFDFLSHSYAGRGNAVALTKLNGYAGIDHVVAVADGSADAEHGVFIGTVEGADGYRVFPAVVTVTG